MTGFALHFVDDRDAVGEREGVRVKEAVRDGRDEAVPTT
jgi:hypothetical protein